MSDSLYSATQCKEAGNRCYETRQYGEAISWYTKAIIKDPTISTFFTNRALCYLKQKKWDKAILDCREALERDNTVVKGHYFLGEALTELKQYDEAIASLCRAQDLAKEQKLNFGDDITSTIRLARKRRWNAIEDKRIAEEIDLQKYLNDLILADRDRRVKTLVEETDEEAGDDCGGKIEKIEEDISSRLAGVNNLFQQVDERRKRREVPDVLCGKISFELLKDPVITPSGITYDKRDIEEHLQRVGHFDPVTRAELTQDQLVPNLSMKEVVEAFLQENPWAEDY